MTTTTSTVTPVTLADLTTTVVDGTGVFDALMRATKAHLEQEFSKNRITGPDYATVYLGALTQVLQTATAFLLAKQKAELEAKLIEQQIALTLKQAEKTASELAQIDAQTLLINQQRTNLVAEALNIPKQGAMIDAQKDTQVSQKAHVEAQTLLVTQQKANAIIEGTVLTAQECKLRAEYDLTLATTLKSGQETALLTQKTATERAQITSMGVDADSVVGRQKALYLAQTNGFTRDAEQKAAKLMVDSWSVRRTTDDATSANTTNKLDDAAIGRAVDKLLSGVQA